MKNELNTNNSKKLIIGVSILFCTVILIIGGTIAYFTQSDTKNIDNLATIDIRDTLKYTDNKEYMRQGLIPAKVDIAKQAYALTGENKCKDIKGYSACSVYGFNIKNIANVSQELIIDMAPTINDFSNLYFILYEKDKDGNSKEITSSKKLDTLTKEMIQNSNIPSYNLIKDLTLNPNSDKTYEIVFFVNNTDTDQTLEDAGKSFGATIKISSVTTGKYMVESFGEDCWSTELLSDGTYKLTEFHGINNDAVVNFETGEITYGENFGVIENSCAAYISKNDQDEFYSIYIPSKLGNQEISTIGNTLFSAATFDRNYNITSTRVNYSKINNIKIEEGITKIEDGCIDPELCPETNKIGTAFYMLGFSDSNSEKCYDDYKLNIFFPNTLTHIGDGAFFDSYINNGITIPENVEYIGEYAFSYFTDVNFVESNNEKLRMIIDSYAFYSVELETIVFPKKTYIIGDNAFESGVGAKLKNIIFNGALDGTSKLEVIGESAFFYNVIENLVIPASVKRIENGAFHPGHGVDYVEKRILRFIDTKENPSQLEYLSGFNGYNIESLEIPSSVTTIGDYAFNSSNILELTIPSNVTTIGNDAFSGNNISKLTIPSSVTSIGNNAFSWNDNLTTLIFEDTKENPSRLKEIGGSAFVRCNLTYTDSNNPLIIPSNVTSIESSAFASNSNGTDDQPENRNLKFLRFNGTLNIDNPANWYSSDNTTLLKD